MSDVETCDLCGKSMRLRRSVQGERSLYDEGPPLAWFCPDHGERRTQS